MGGTSADNRGKRILAMSAFGERLRREREMRGITLDEIWESTKISRRHLESLEREDFDSLPGGIFNKGFVRSYARFLGLDEDQAVADYSAANNEQPSPPDQFPLEVHQKPNRELNPRRSPLPMILAIVALVGVLAGFWGPGQGASPARAGGRPPPPHLTAAASGAPVIPPPLAAETPAPPSPAPPPPPSVPTA